ncbi:protein MON2-like isoform X1 [Brassica napus]|uniref:protein MON2-like isoform X1 n=1 Tax=Brassica napus TaxID=3708 RepID=UPI00207850E3|nr:protein MON2-like isoform X1 [Brassica napus]
MALVAVLEADLRALFAEAPQRYPVVKDGAEQAILKLRSSSSASDLSSNEDILRIFLTACGVRNTKLSVIGLSCLQNLISHDAVEPSSLKEILATLKYVLQVVIKDRATGSTHGFGFFFFAGLLIHVSIDLLSTIISCLEQRLLLLQVKLLFLFILFFCLCSSTLSPKAE